MTLGQQATVLKNPILAWREIDGELVIISPEESVMHELNATGSFIWSQIDGRQTAEEIAERLAEEYGVPQDTARADTADLLGELLAKKLVIPAGREFPAEGAESHG